MRTTLWLKSLKGRDHSIRPMRRWEDNFKINLREVVLEGVDWIHLDLDWDRRRVLVNTVTNPEIP